jgi:hypothetical protein
MLFRQGGRQVATWGELVKYVKVNYHVSDQTDRMLRLQFPVGDRSQVVFVWHVWMADGEDWIQIESPIGKLTDINVRALLELVEKAVVGGAAALEGFAVLRHAVPLADMCVAEFKSPFMSIIVLADQFENQLTGMDRY